MRIYVGYDTREDIAYQVCRHSILTRNENVSVTPLKQNELREQGWYHRPVDKLASTEFTFTRFLVPELTNFDGWALFCDSDCSTYGPGKPHRGIQDCCNMYSILQYKKHSMEHLEIASDNVFPTLRRLRWHVTT